MDKPSQKSLAERLPEWVMVAVMIFYSVSLLLTFGAAQAFFIVTPADIGILVGMSTIPALIAWYLTRAGQSGLVFALIHLYLAVLFHPRITYKDPVYIDENEQLQLLQQLHSATAGETFERQVSLALARAIQSDASLRFQIDHPVASWAYPPSLVLLFWSVAFMFLLRRRAALRAEPP